MGKIWTIGELKEAISKFDDNDSVVVDINDSLFLFSIDSMGGVQLTDGTTITEVRLCI